MATFPAVLDACVLYNAAVRDTLLWAAYLQLFRVHWSQAILDETTLNLVEDGRMTPMQAQRFEQICHQRFPYAMVDPAPPDLIDAMQVDPKDRHVAATAVIADAKVIVTFNLSDFPEAGLEPYGIEAQSPDEFLCHQYWLSPEAVADVIRKQASNLKKPPIPIDAVLENLRKFVPDFVALVEPHLVGTEIPSKTVS